MSDTFAHLLTKFVQGLRKLPAHHSSRKSKYSRTDACLWRTEVVRGCGSGQLFEEADRLFRGLCLRHFRAQKQQENVNGMRSILPKPKKTLSELKGIRPGVFTA